MNRCILALGLIAAMATEARAQTYCTGPTWEGLLEPGARQQSFPQPSFHTLATRARRVGDAALRAGDPARALAHFQEGLRAAPRYLNLHCGAVLAAVRADDRPAALQHATVVEGTYLDNARPRPAAACLYNAGLAFEALGLPARARRVWARSLELRPASSVRAALRRLPSASSPAAGTPWQPIIRRLAQRASASFPGEAEVTTSVQQPVGSSTVLDARIVRVRMVAEEFGMVEEAIYLAVRRGDAVTYTSLDHFDHRRQGEYDELIVERFSLDGPHLWLETFLASVSSHGDDRRGVYVRHLWWLDGARSEDGLRRMKFDDAMFQQDTSASGREGWRVAYAYDERTQTQVCIQGNRVTQTRRAVVAGVPLDSAEVPEFVGAERTLRVRTLETQQGTADEVMTVVPLQTLPNPVGLLNPAAHD